MSQQAIRPKIHFAPPRGWINDPNGLVFDGETYHLFAQHNPDDTVWGPMHWLHATSADLLHWQDQGIALYPCDLGTIFSGSAVIDRDNLAGFGKDAMVAIFTLHGDKQRQGIAYSTDYTNFKFYEGNPVIDNSGAVDFRDPKVFWDDERNRWAMALAAGTCIEFYHSPNLKDWTKTGEFGAELRVGNEIYECPDLFKLSAPDGKDYWALLISFSGKVRYYIGEYDGDAFVETASAGKILMLDQGFDHYAGTTFSGVRARIYMHWAADPHYAGDVPECGYRGHLSLPRIFSLADTNDGLRLAQIPMVSPEKDSDASLDIRIAATGAFMAIVQNAKGECIRFGLCAKNELFIDRREAGALDAHGHMAESERAMKSVPRLRTGALDARLIIDGNVAELYMDGGVYQATLLCYPAEPYTDVIIQGDAELLR